MNVPHLVTALKGPLLELERRVLEAQPAIEHWLRTQWQERSVPFYCSVDLRTGLEAIAEGDLTQAVVPVTPELARTTNDEIGDVAEAVGDIRNSTVASVTAYNATREQLASMIGEISNNAQTVSAASEQMASTSDETGRAVGEIANAVGDVAQGAERQVRMVEAARRSAQDAASAASTSSAGSLSSSLSMAFSDSGSGEAKMSASRIALISAEATSGRSPSGAVGPACPFSSSATVCLRIADRMRRVGRPRTLVDADRSEAARLEDPHQLQSNHFEQRDEGHDGRTVVHLHSGWKRGQDALGHDDVDQIGRRKDMGYD